MTRAISVPSRMKSRCTKRARHGNRCERRFTTRSAPAPGSSGVLDMSDGKQGLREEVWHTLTVNKVARFPGAQRRIPNFIGAEAAARHLTTLSLWQHAHALKCNPDAPQRPVRYAALQAGKILYM